MNRIERRTIIRAVVGIALGIGFYALILKFQFVFMNPSALDLIFVFVTYLIAWSVRGIYQDNKDTMIAGMGDVELTALKAQIEQVLKDRNKKENS